VTNAGHAPIRWAGKVRQDQIRRLYELDAAGIRDEELIDEVGFGLLARCRSILEVTEAARGRAKCHGCGAIIEHAVRRDALLHCSACGWEAEWRAYQRSYQGRQLFGGAALGFFTDFTARYPEATTPRERLLLIDRLIHEFHWNLTRRDPEPQPTRPTAANLIEGGTLREVVAFLDSLAGRDPAPG